MKRNLDLARAILLAVEQFKGSHLSTDDIVVGGFTVAEVRYNAELLRGQGYLEGMVISDLSDIGPSQIIIQRLTWRGHDFLDVARSQDDWSDAKKRAGKVGSTLTFELMKELLIAVIKDRLGLPAA